MPYYGTPSYRRYYRRRYSSGRMSGKELAMVVAIGASLALVSGRAVTHAVSHPAVADAAAPAPSAARAIAYARAQLGKPYVWGGTGPDGFDCSGLTSTAWRAAGVTIPRTSEEQWAAGHRVAHPKFGDLVYSYWDVDNQASPNHVQIYVGHGQVIGADTTDVEEVPLSGDAGHIVGYTDPAAGS